ncbi:SWI/SNF complex subunit SWI3C-like [Phoenix dactylifera]|uniref:SWI/SNF complex subunit SWI3C-like n=1 Tax=Phoenix dactylifera TaxID=42345 RepID=A0A8B7CVU0_PHODC|nr:SWI/SNF complex subunit SWI3C-like [Phoenix dactylifera]
MSPASPSLPSSDSRLKWRKRKRDSNSKRQKPHDDDEEDDEEEEAAAAEEAAEDDDHDSQVNNPASDPVLDLREAEVLSDAGQRISDFPAAVRRTVNRPHPSVLALVAVERSLSSSSAASAFASAVPRPWAPPFLENISHGQLQALSFVLPDNPSLLQPPDLDKPSAYVCTPPPLMEGKGVVKRFGREHYIVLPMHADWFSLTTVHRLERQVVPHFFSGKSSDHTPERYITLRNKIVAKYLENPGKRLSFVDCQGLVANNELYDLSRIVRFLDHWGIINYLATSSVHRGLRMAGCLLNEETTGELQLKTGPLRSIDSLVLFDRPKCSLRMEDIALLSSSSSSASVDSDSRLRDLDGRIRERLSEHACNYCSRPLPNLHYQSQKEADVILCSDCFHDAKFVTGHSSLDFLRVDSRKDTPDLDGDSWSDQETLLLLEALEKYNDNWNEIAEHVGTKSKAQCILHFIRLPTEDGLLENIELPHMAVSSDSLKGHKPGLPFSDSNGDATGTCLQELNSGDQIPFGNSSNPVMSLVAFLTSAIGPRVAAACASAALSVLTKEDPRLSSESTHSEVGAHGAHANLGCQKDETPEDQVPYAKKDATSPLSPEHIKLAAKSGLCAAAMKAKLFADQEEREIQRLAATIINHQLKRLELKLKQFAEVETTLLKECEQGERTRQRLSADRVRTMSTRFAQAGTTHSSAAGPAAAAAAAALNANTRQPTMSPSVGQANISPAFGNNLPGHPQMSFMQRQQMFGFGPRLPLSAIHPSPSTPSPNVMFNSGVASTSNHHPLLRSSSGNNSSIG